MKALLLAVHWPIENVPVRSDKMVKGSQVRSDRREHRRPELTVGMIKRLYAPTLMLFVCLALGSCTSFSFFVSDHWPTWAGGMPNDVPPRPGAPGYDEFIARQQGKDATAAVPPATPVAVPTGAPAAGNTNVQAIPNSNRPPNDQSAVEGGLY
jgi:hypothetical protein